MPWGSKDHWIDGRLEKIIISVEIYNQQFQGTVFFNGLWLIGNECVWIEYYDLPHKGPHTTTTGLPNEGTLRLIAESTNFQGLHGTDLNRIGHKWLRKNFHTLFFYISSPFHRCWTYDDFVFSTYGTCLLLIFSNWEVMSGLVKGKELSSGQCPTTTTEWHTFHQISSSGDVRPCIFLSQLKIKKATRRDQWPIITNLLTWATKYNNNV